MNLISEALRLAKLGLPVFPLHHITAAGCCSCRRTDCPAPGKHPSTAHGLHDATADLDLVRWLWSRAASPYSNIGVALGSGLFVLDLDGPLPPWEPLPSTLTSTTGRGRHLWFRAPQPVRSRVRVAPGVDVRGDGGYVVAPPSLHVSGRRYQWADVCEPAPAPAWLLRLIGAPALHRIGDAAPSHLPNHTGGAAITGRQARVALRGEVVRVRRSTIGARNASLNKAAFSLGRILATGHLDERDVRAQLTAAALDVGLARDEIERTLASGLAAGKRNPRPRAGSY